MKKKKFWKFFECAKENENSLKLNNKFYNETIPILRVTKKEKTKFIFVAK